MIHLIALLKAKPGLTREEFRDHWKNVHGPLVAGIEADNPLTAYYAQYARTDADYDRAGAPDFDGVAIQSFNSYDDFKAFVSQPDVAAKLGPDGPKYTDTEKSMWIMTEDPSIFIDRRA